MERALCTPRGLPLVATPLARLFSAKRGASLPRGVAAHPPQADAPLHQVRGRTAQRVVPIASYAQEGGYRWRGRTAYEMGTQPSPFEPSLSHQPPYETSNPFDCLGDEPIVGAFEGTGEAPAASRRTLPLREGRSAEVKGEVSSTLEPSSLVIKRIPPAGRIPTLSYGLERVLFNPGVHWLRDARTNVYNYDPFLRKLAHPDDFDLRCMPPFVPASSDETLHAIAKAQRCSYVTSSSSITQSMSLIYFVLTRMKGLNLDCLSQSFSDEPRTFTLLSRSPSSVILRPHSSTLRSIVIDKGPVVERENILMKMGNVMERLLTEPKEEYLGMFLQKPLPAQQDAPLGGSAAGSSAPGQANGSSAEERGAQSPGVQAGGAASRPRTLQVQSASETLDVQEAYSYMVAGKMLMRSQIDCHDARLPRGGTFDIKTRATLPVRMDMENWKKHGNYHLRTADGLFNSFEREYFDMCRSAMLKYNFQVRIGDMDGIFVAYHNASEIFGFQYISREEMDERIYGNGATGDAAFSLILQVYNGLLDVIVPKYPSDALLRLTFSSDRAGTVRDLPAALVGGIAEHLCCLHVHALLTTDPPRIGIDGLFRGHF